MKKEKFIRPSISIFSLNNEEVITCSGFQPINPVDDLADIQSTVEKI